MKTVSKLPQSSLVLLMLRLSILNSPQDAHAISVGAGNQAGESGDVEATLEDAIPPNAPGNLSVVRLSANEVEVQWVDNSSDELGFDIFRAAGSEPWKLRWTVPPNTTSKVDVAPADVSYRYVVKARKANAQSLNNYGYSAPSNEFIEYSANVKLAAAVYQTPLPTHNSPWYAPSDHPQPTGTVALGTDVLSGPYDHWTAVIDPLNPNNAQASSWDKDKNITKKVGASYSLNVTMATDGLFDYFDEITQQPVYQIGIVGGGASTDVVPNSFDGLPYNYVVQPNYSHATFTQSGQFALYLGKLEGLSDGFDRATNPRWQLLPKGGSKVLHFQVAPSGGTRKKHFSTGGLSQVVPVETVSASESLTLESVGNDVGETSVTAEVESVGTVASLSVDIRPTRNVTVAMIVLTQDQMQNPTQHVRDQDPIPPTKAPSTDHELQDPLNSIYYTPQTNLTFLVTRYAIAVDYDQGVRDGVLDKQDPREWNVLANLVDHIPSIDNTNVKYDRYLFFVHKVRDHGKNEDQLLGVGTSFAGRFACIADTSDDVIQTAAHELGHLLNLRHSFEPGVGNFGNPNYLPQDDFDSRLMGYGDGNRLIYTEWKAIWTFIESGSFP